MWLFKAKLIKYTPEVSKLIFKQKELKKALD